MEGYLFRSTHLYRLKEIFGNGYNEEDDNIIKFSFLKTEDYIKISSRKIENQKAYEKHLSFLSRVISDKEYLEKYLLNNLVDITDEYYRIHGNPINTVKLEVKKVEEEKRERKPIIKQDVQIRPRITTVVVQPPPIKGKVYSKVDINISFLDKEEDNSIKLGVTLNKLEDLIEEKAFQTSCKNNLEKLLDWKISVYNKKLEEYERKIDLEKKKNDAIEKFGYGKKNLDLDLLQSNIEYHSTISTLISIIESKKKNLSEQSIKQAYSKSINLIKDIIGESRSDIRDFLTLQLYSLSKTSTNFKNTFLNLILAGGTGTGKTFVAEKIAAIYSTIGVMCLDVYRVVSAADLIAGYTGQTAIKTLGILKSSLEAVLLIDEAYQLTPCDKSSTSFSSDSITELVNFLSQYVGLSVVIAAGYTNEMTNCFLTFNEGLPGRFPNVFILKDYTSFDLFHIFIEYVRFKGGKDIGDFNEEQLSYIYSMIDKIRTIKPESFKNMARDVQNLSNIFVQWYLISGLDWKSEWKKITNNSFANFLCTKGLYIKFG